MNFEKIIADARASSFGLWKLNLGLSRMIPFNRPHGIKIAKIEEDKVVTQIKYKRRNLNHIKGIHACGLATCAEFASGFLLISKLDAKKYRLIMQTIDMEYHYQAKKDTTAEFECTDQWVKENITNPLSSQEKVNITCKINLYDSERNHVATGHTNWQIKPWDKVKTAL